MKGKWAIPVIVSILILGLSGLVPAFADPDDLDVDGISNDNDLCPGTAAGETVDANGCSPAQLDSDGGQHAGTCFGSTFELDRDVYSPGQDVILTLVAPNADMDPNDIDLVWVSMYSPDREKYYGDLPMIETGMNTGIFQFGDHDTLEPFFYTASSDENNLIVFEFYNDFNLCDYFDSVEPIVDFGTTPSTPGLIPTEISLNHLPSGMTEYLNYMIEGYLTTLDGTPLSNKEVNVLYDNSDTGYEVTYVPVTTDSNGYYSAKIGGGSWPGTHELWIFFEGDSDYDMSDTYWPNIQVSEHTWPKGGCDWKPENPDSCINDQYYSDFNKGPDEVKSNVAHDSPQTYIIAKSYRFWGEPMIISIYNPCDWLGTQFLASQWYHDGAHLNFHPSGVGFDFTGLYTAVVQHQESGTYIGETTFSVQSGGPFVSSPSDSQCTGQSTSGTGLIPIELSLNRLPSSMIENLNYIIDGYLKTSDGTPLSGKVVDIIYLATEGDEVTSLSVTTDSNGYYSAKIGGGSLAGTHELFIWFNWASDNYGDWEIHIENIQVSENTSGTGQSAGDIKTITELNQICKDTYGSDYKFSLSTKTGCESTSTPTPTPTPAPVVPEDKSPADSIKDTRCPEGYVFLDEHEVCAETAEHREKLKKERVGELLTTNQYFNLNIVGNCQEPVLRYTDSGFSIEWEYGGKSTGMSIIHPNKRATNNLRINCDASTVSFFTFTNGGVMSVHPIAFTSSGILDTAKNNEYLQDMSISINGQSVETFSADSSKSSTPGIAFDTRDTITRQKIKILNLPMMPKSLPKIGITESSTPEKIFGNCPKPTITSWFDGYALAWVEDSPDGGKNARGFKIGFEGGFYVQDYDWKMSNLKIDCDSKTLTVELEGSSTKNIQGELYVIENSKKNPSKANLAAKSMSISVDGRDINYQLFKSSSSSDNTEFSFLAMPGGKTLTISNIGLIPEPLQKTESAVDSTPKVKEKVPGWIKNNAKWWSEGSISDSDYIGGLQHLIKEDIITVPRQAPVESAGSDEIPDWVKNNAGWWANGQISEEEFLNSVQYLIKEGIIKV